MGEVESTKECPVCHHQHLVGPEGRVVCGGYSGHCFCGAGDDPEMDATDGAHPAWWRGHEYASAMIIARLLVAFNPELDNGEGVLGNSGLERIRRFILEHR